MQLIKRIINFFRNLGIRPKLWGGYSLVVVISLLLCSIFIYSLVRQTVEQHIESELQNSTAAILSMVQTSANVSIKNYLRAVAEQNREIVAQIYSEYQAGTIRDEAAKNKALKVLFSQRIGETGYIYCVDSTGIAIAHPNPQVAGRNFAHLAFVQEQMKRREGYLEYDWQNPGEQQTLPKALYMTYFAPWDWIISVSSYRHEFKQLVNVEDFREEILALRFGKTGYSFIIDGAGNLVVHPLISGNLINAVDGNGVPFVRELCRQKSGKMTYSWKNPGEPAYRDKLMMFNYLPEYDWIVASSSYMDEIYAPLGTMGNILWSAVGGTLLLILPITLLISTPMIRTLRALMGRFSAAASGDLSVRMPGGGTDELGKLADHFNHFMDKLEVSSKALQSEVRERQRSENALRLSEELFSKAFRSSPSGVVLAAVNDGRIIDANDSFLRMTGHRGQQLENKTVWEIDFFNDRETGKRIFQQLLESGRLANRDIEFRTGSRELRQGIIAAELIELWGEQCMLAAVEDLTDIRRLEKEVLNVSEREIQRIGLALHDDLCPHLIGIEALNKVLTVKLRKAASPEAPAVAKIGALLTEAIRKSRSLSRGLMPVDPTAHGLVASLAEMADVVNNIYGINCTLATEREINMHDNVVANHIYYIAHEAVHNAIKHSAVQHVNMCLTHDVDLLRLVVEDDGGGFAEPAANNGMGLHLMKYRARCIGGTLDVNSIQGQGVIVQLSVNTLTNMVA